MVSVKVEIIKPFIEGQKKGDIGNVELKGAIEFEKQGVLKILDKKKRAFNRNIDNNSDPLKQIIERQKQLEGDNYIEIFAGDDKKIEKQLKQKKFNVNNSSIEEIEKTIKEFNNNSYGVFFNYNPANKPQRLKANIKRILYIFIDLDDANEEHNETIKTNLKKYNITYSYNAQSGHGYHFLIPVDLEPDKELNVKAFLTYLRDNICDKVDVATYTNERLFRIPCSMHHKDDISKQLITLHSHKPSFDEIETNNKQIFKYQLEQKKGVKDIAYQNSIKKQDIFFSTILTNKESWSKYHKLLDSAADRNDNFIKNLGFFLNSSPNFRTLAESFLSNWEPARISALNGWIKKAKEHNTSVLYHELLKWSKANNLKDFISLLNKQNRETFLDKYEVYYLEDESKERAYLLYYPEKNYYVQKSLSEVLQTIYYDCKEIGVDLVTEFNLDCLDGWEDMTFKKQLSLIHNAIHQRLEKELRIKMVFNINYEPSDNKFIVLDNKKFFNTYNKSMFWDYKKEQKQYGFPHIKELLMNLCGEDEKNFNYFNKWLAWIIQNPCDKLPTAIIFQGKQGSGKGQFKSNILDNIFAHNCQEINQTHLESSFNEYLLGKQIIIANEVMHNENRQVLPNILKNLVTDEYITIQRKFRSELVCKNYTHWIFCTNNDNPIKIDEDDRRYSVFYSEKLKGGGKAAAEFITSLRKNIEFELKEYISYLKSIEVEYYEVHEPIMTKAKEEIIDLNKDTIIKFLEDLPRFKDLDDLFMHIFGSKNPANFIGDGEITIDTDSFYRAYVEWCNKNQYKGVFQKQNFSKKLSQLGIVSFPRKFKEYPESPKWQSVRVYSRENIEQFMEVEN